MKENPKQASKNKSGLELNDILVYPKYPSHKEIYWNYLEAMVVDPEIIFKYKESIKNDMIDIFNGKDIDDESGCDLDIHGFELGDIHEDIESLDEENNCYS